MKVAIDVSPISSGHYLAHKVRGTGFYLKNLQENLVSLYGKEDFRFFSRGEEIGNVDIVHYPYFEPFFLSLPLKKIAKTIVTVHDLTPIVFKEDFPPGIKGNIKWRLQKKSLQNVDFIITDSKSSKKDIHEITGIDDDKIRVIYLAAAKHFKQIEELDKKEFLSKFSLPESFILYVGDVTPNKNLPRIIEAINKTNYNLVIVGKAFANEDFDRENVWNKDLKKAKELSLGSKKIVSLGFVEDSDLVKIYNIASTLVMPSLYEGFGLPILEAMQSGCPVITSKRGSLGEVGMDAALYVDPLSVDSIASGINKVMGDANLRKSLSQAGIKNAKKFTWEKTAIETYDVYKSILK